ncbi:CDP-diacylglycerol--glycerol-3-phosphate 3-phosphatidyltransferase [Sporolactobacillus pectinivorans]|uniref:CDP-diacylglycerol--glycerol-3-phosphate 3-phosphatidyltransferase n=1 Tax=Sporolactobacillus pectinivorans TaxID=1591408 RepID=UPI0012FD424B|nr:CDP-diacylglycerol--glycerol-3-phosphate 3-phosphatidyltransferase [Sporolactobacillus pectinivorans]
MTANKITILRLILIPFFLFFLLMGENLSIFISLLIFISAALTDKLDGYIAKKYQQTTDLGKILDPLADKLLVFAALAVFTAQRLTNPIALFIIIIRELTITSVRVVVANNGTVVGAGFSGKLKTAIQLIAIMAILALPLLHVIGVTSVEPYNVLISNVLSWIMAIFSVISGVDYLLNGLSLKNITK